MDQPLSIPRFIALVTDEPVDHHTVATWFKCVRKHAPAGTLLSIPTTDDRGMPRTTCLIHRETDRAHLYIVPLSRDLEEFEGARIVDAFSDLRPDADFDIHSSAMHVSEPDISPPIVVDEEKYLALCTAWAKRQHDAWMKDREAQGWRYGVTLSLANKTNPLMMPWEQLPARYRVPNLDEPQALLSLLNDQGYTVVTKNELESMMTLMRQSSTMEGPKK